MTQPVVFISYSHNDEQEKDKLLSHLGVLQTGGLVELWNDDRIGAGADWEQEIREAITQARVAILLITANFLTSNFILREEVPTLLKRRQSEGLVVFPVIAKACAWRKVDWLTKMNVRPKNGSPVWGDYGSHVDEDLAVIAEEVATIIKRVDDYTGPRMSEINLQEQRAAVRVNLGPWAYLAERTPKFPDRLLHGQDLGRDDDLFRSLHDFLRSSLSAGLSVEVYSSRPQALERISNPEEFWMMLISALVLDSEGQGPLKWLIKETVRALREGTITSISMVSKVWEYICQRYCNHLSRHHRPEVLDTIAMAAISSAGRNYDFLFRFFTFLYDRLESDSLSIQRIAQHLQHYDEQLGNDAAPSFLERLKYLTGTGIAIATHGIGDIPPFSPKLVTIPRSRVCPYEFEAMVYPLTVYDYSSIRGVPPKKLGENPLYPYVFKIVSEEGYNLFNLLASEVFSIVNLCRRREADDRFDWDVPTVCEWLALSGCENQPYPWGIEMPTLSHANLDFGTPSKLRPVGTHLLGASKFGTQDCCGNVHEIVRISDGSLFPRDFRLAGGCYQTNAQLASCQIFRPFKTKREDNRRNVGLKLIRYLKQDTQKRFSAIRATQFSFPNSGAIVFRDRDR